MIVCYDKNMKANQFRIISVSVAVRIDDACDVARQLSDVSSNFGICMGTTQKVPNRAEWTEIRITYPRTFLVSKTKSSAEMRNTGFMAERWMMPIETSTCQIGTYRVASQTARGLY